MTSDETNSASGRMLPPPQSGGPRWRRRAGAGLLAGMLAIGAAAGAGGMQLAQRFRTQPVMMLQPVAINALKEGTPAAVKGQVADIFGNAFVLTDGTGRTLIDTGRRGEGQSLVAPQENVTVQGRFDGGKLHAQVLVHADGRTEGFGPPMPPRPERGPPDAPPPRDPRDRPPP